MIPVSHMVLLLQAEREEQLRRWQRTHPALPQRAAGPGILTRLLRALDPMRPRPGLSGHLPCPGDSRTAAACC